MKITRAICLALAATLLSGPLALADNPKLSSDTNKRQQAQAELRQKGVRPGELTPELRNIKQLDKHDAQPR